MDDVKIVVNKKLESYFLKFINYYYKQTFFPCVHTNKNIISSLINHKQFLLHPNTSMRLLKLNSVCQSSYVSVSVW